MAHALCMLAKSTVTHSDYVIRNAFPQQQWLRERALMLRLYVHCLSCLNVELEQCASGNAPSEVK
jgi:hypothetical protein